MKQSIVKLTLVASLLTLSACSSVTGLFPGILSPATVASLVGASTSAFLGTLSPGNQAVVANYGDRAAALLYADSGSAITASQLQADLNAAIPASSVPSIVTQGEAFLLSVLTPYIPKITGNWAAYINPIAAAIQTANAPFISTATPATASAARQKLQEERSLIRQEITLGRLNPRDAAIQYALAQRD